MREYLCEFFATVITILLVLYSYKYFKNYHLLVFLGLVAAAVGTYFSYLLGGYGNSNPLVTFSSWLNSEITTHRLFWYIGVQILGVLFAIGIYKLLNLTKSIEKDAE